MGKCTCILQWRDNKLERYLFKQKRYISRSRNDISQSWNDTVLCKSNANDNRHISRFVLAIYRCYINETLHGLPNVKTINQRDIGAIFAISRRDIVLASLCRNDISQSKTIYRCSEVHCKRYVVVNCTSTIYHNEAIVYDESVFVYM